ncbi:phosphotransferase [Microlunatus parietis]|uniref:Thiamine kinase-like enzyme n=1 Tax=Microlunatus parietis TaxID=682979 RepID=A0A7Y9LAG6_9ACTN|nr:phosphotransferase [Microlunatus parietis]NYE68686.1 thiamine kinase-like enzyme [Microlunatus parietis]
MRSSKPISHEPTAANLTRDSPPTPALRELITAALDKAPVAWHKPHTGLSAACFVVTFHDGSTAFVKSAVDDQSASLIRNEHEVISTVGSDLVPSELAWLDDGERPVLVIEDLSSAHWPADHEPVNWKPGQFDLMFAALNRVAELPPPPSLPSAPPPSAQNWPLITEDVEAFMTLGLCSRKWFNAAVNGLAAAERDADQRGEALVHNDVRSDNLCFLGQRVVLVDWAQAFRGNPEYDVATAASTLPLEGGPDPHDVLPDGGRWAALLAGRYVHRTLREPELPDWFRRVLQRIAVICLSWASRSLDLPRWDGPTWNQIR